MDLMLQLWLVAEILSFGFVQHSTIVLNRKLDILDHKSLYIVFGDNDRFSINFTGYPDVL